jgi:enediyne biosynthesis protein E4
LITVYGPTEGLIGDDVLSAPAQADAVFLQQADGTFVDEASAWGLAQPDVGRGMVVTDFNGDGWLDVFKTRYRGGAARLWLARCDDTAWLTVRLTPSAPAHHAFGARVEVTIGDRKLTRWLQPSSTGVASSGPPELHFGLGDAEFVSKMTVRWPNGTTDVFGSFATSQHVEIVQAAIDRNRR